MELRVRVNDELTLDCGRAERDSRAGTGWTLVPPDVSQFDQLIDYLERKPDAARGARSVVDVETLAATALCLRWGTWFAVLADAGRPRWPLAGEPGVAHLSVEELHRIRLEATDAFERWIEIYRSGRACTRAIQLAIRAVAYLPGHAGIGALRMDAATRGDGGLAPTSTAEIGTDERAAVDEAPSRALASRLAAETCEAEPIANLAGGCVFPLPLDACRFPPELATRMFARVNARMKAAIWTCSWLAHESDLRRPWTERVLPFVEPGLTPHALRETPPVVRLSG
jgi:hypothetical protein